MAVATGKSGIPRCKLLTKHTDSGRYPTLRLTILVSGHSRAPIPVHTHMQVRTYMNMLHDMLLSSCVSQFEFHTTH